MSRVNGIHRNRYIPRPPRTRILFADAATIRTRVQDAATALHLTGARIHVLHAALTLLCGWSRIRDDAVSINQILELCGPEHRYDPKTIGRVLKALTAAALIEYTPARGRSRRATIAIHPRFLDRITELDRDIDGTVITFSDTCPSISQREIDHHPDIAPDGPRPTEVPVNTRDVRTVFAALASGPLDALPPRLRWCLSGEIRTYLRRGFRADQIIKILTAPMPDTVNRPFRLAKWRLVHNMVGPGPRLRPLQRAWDRAHHAARQLADAAAANTLAEQIRTVTTTSMRERMLTTLSHTLHQPIINSAAALLHAARMARRDNPHTSLHEAICHWLSTHEPAPAPEPLTLSAHHTATTGPCLLCKQPGPIRNELPLPSALCDDCWNSGDEQADHAA